MSCSRRQSGVLYDIEFDKTNSKAIVSCVSLKLLELTRIDNERKGTEVIKKSCFFYKWLERLCFLRNNLQFVIYYLSFACDHEFKRYVYLYTQKPTHSFTPFPYCSSHHTFALQSGMFRTLKSSENPSRNLILIWIELSPIFRTWENWELQVKPCLWSMFVIRTLQYRI